MGGVVFQTCERSEKDEKEVHQRQGMHSQILLDVMEHDNRSVQASGARARALLGPDTSGRSPRRGWFFLYHKEKVFRPLPMRKISESIASEFGHPHDAS